MSNTFETNCRYFEFKNSKAAVFLSFAESGAVRVCKTKLNEPNLVEGERFFHSQEGALKEAQEWASTLPLKQVQVITVFGVGMGYGYFALKKWLSEDARRCLIILEDDLRVLLHFFESPVATELLCHPQVHLYHLEDSSDGLKLIQGIGWGTFGKKMHITALPYYEKQRKDIFEEIKYHLLLEMSDIHVTVDEYMVYGLPFFHNFWRNIFLLPQSQKANALRRAFTGIPAIVVAAGPSLAKHLELLKELRDYALILSGGSSVNALLEGGVVPHFGAGIDPNPMQYVRVRQGLSLQLPFFYRQRFMHEAASTVSGPLLYLRGGDGYNTPEWFEKKLHISGEILGGGHSISNFCIDIARFLGCSSIILVGYDLAYGDNLQHYAPGVEDGAAPSAQKQVVTAKNQEGQTVSTEWKWLVEAKWIEEFAAAHPRCTLINATEGGLGLKGIPNVRLSDLKETLFTQKLDLDGLVQMAIGEAPSCATDYNEILKATAQMYDSLARAITCLEKLASLVLKSQIAKDDEVQCCESPEFIITLNELKEEIAFVYILEVFDRMKNKLEFYYMQLSSYPTQKEEERTKLELSLLGDRFLFLKQVATCNQQLIVLAIKQEQAKGYDTKAFCPKSEVVW
ncbi:MAG: motility associated factor glycosyltransferase family protein [Verrucomicrobia bacterium]|nr:motility associated factor glycosyltransferase family protein [Verrucomicrobiota bacterium]